MMQKQKEHPNPCWILTSERSGSWYLTSLLNSVGFTFDEHFKSRWHSNKFLIQNLPIHTKILRRHFVGYFSDEDRGYIEEQLPGIKYIYLKREDRIASAISYFFALKTNIFYLPINSEKEYQAYLQQKIPFSYEEILEIYNYLAEYTDKWDSFLQDANFLEIYFEDMDLEAILEYIGVDCGASKLQSGFMSLRRPESQEYIERFKELLSLNTL